MPTDEKVKFLTQISYTEKSNKEKYNQEIFNHRLRQIRRFPSEFRFNFIQFSEKASYFGKMATIYYPVKLKSRNLIDSCSISSITGGGDECRVKPIDSKYHVIWSRDWRHMYRQKKHIERCETYVFPRQNSYDVTREITLPVNRFISLLFLVARLFFFSISISDKDGLIFYYHRLLG